MSKILQMVWKWISMAYTGLEWLKMNEILQMAFN